MALIWADGFDGNNALAPLWQAASLATRRLNDPTLSPTERGAAFVAQGTAQAAYEQAAAQAQAAVRALPGDRTHAFVVGVGRYRLRDRIPEVSTSVHGGRAFAEWLLTAFDSPDRPLASIEMFESFDGDWVPSDAAAAKLGLPPGAALPGEPALFESLRNAFDRFLGRARQGQLDAGHFYFSGHGMWKGSPLLLPEDAIVGNTFGNIIDLEQTRFNMFNTAPAIQCFFMDACQEVTPQLLQNLDRNPGDPLRRSVSGPAIPDREARIYAGSFIGATAGGFANQAPFFTQELIGCFESRAGHFRRGADWMVTPQSLQDALLAAGTYRGQLNGGDPLQFSIPQATSNILAPRATLCRLSKPPEVFVSVGASPSACMPLARLYIDPSGGSRLPRNLPNPADWMTLAPLGDHFAGAEFDAGAGFVTVRQPFEARPPLVPVILPQP